MKRAIPRHGVPSQLLSDHAAAFHSKLMAVVHHLMGIQHTIHIQVGWWNTSIKLCLTCYRKWPNRMWRIGTALSFCPIRSSPQISTGECFMPTTKLRPATSYLRICPMIWRNTPTVIILQQHIANGLSRPKIELTSMACLLSAIIGKTQLQLLSL